MAEKNSANIGFEEQLWKAACVLWGHIPAAEYRKVIVGLIFLRYISSVFDKKYQQLVAEGDGFEKDKDEYTALSEEFSTYISSREYEYRQLLEYYVFRYFAKSIYDYDVLGKCQMLVTNFFMIKQMDMLKWLDNHRNYSFDDRMDIVHIFSRQVEYSEENIENLYEDFIFDDVFNPDSLKAILWLDGDSM